MASMVLCLLLVLFFAMAAFSAIAATWHSPPQTEGEKPPHHHCPQLQLLLIITISLKFFLTAMSTPQLLLLTNTITLQLQLLLLTITTKCILPIMHRQPSILASSHVSNGRLLTTFSASLHLDFFGKSSFLFYITFNFLKTITTMVEPPMTHDRQPRI